MSHLLSNLWQNLRVIRLRNLRQNMTESCACVLCVCFVPVALAPLMTLLCCVQRRHHSLSCPSVTRVAELMEVVVTCVCNGRWYLSHTCDTIQQSYSMHNSTQCVAIRGYTRVFRIQPQGHYSENRCY